VRYEFKNGQLVKEDTIFWDNGMPYDVINYVADSAHYVQTIYDYNGKRYNEIVYDNKGVFVRVNFQPERMKYFTIGDLKVSNNPDDRFFFYDHLDTLSNELKDSLLIFRSWFKEDTSMLYSRYYNPAERMLRYEMYSITGKTPLRAEMEFSENFESWNGKKWYTFGDLTLQTTASSSLYEYYEKDSIPQQMINQYDEIYDITQDQVLYQKGKPFTGDLTLTTSTKSLEISGGSHLRISLPKMHYDEGTHKDLARYRKKGKTRNKFLFSVIDASELDEEFSETIFGNLVGGFIPTIEYPYSYDGYDEFGGEVATRESQRSPFVKTIEGSFLEGKPQGEWNVYDQFGKLLYSMNFEKGVLHGPYKEFDTKEPEQDYYDVYEEEVSSLLKDTFPKRKTHYLYSSTDYKNGYENGKYIRFNWYGGIEEEVNYLDGMAQGTAFERNKLAYTSLNYKDGELDGYVKTYLTLNGTDSTLLFDLNFQNGLLQGESKAYHLSGRMAKRGFFLNGEPIDDYEAYDTLGFRYHYVKFQFGFPVEEKIWEENELSVRYMFDWRDSIYFQPTDITSTQSLDRVLANLGIGSDYYQRPYFGRPSLVNKQGIDYHITKYYPNDTIARDGQVSSGKKVSCWKYYSYEGEFLYEADYFDTIIKVNDSIQFKAKGILIDYDRYGRKLSESYIIEKFEKYDCSHTDHYEIRQLMTIWQGKDSVDRMNGYVKNYYDNGVLQNEGMMKNGLPTGVWKFYDPFGKLNQVGTYVMGKRDGRWLGGDLSKTKYLGDICLNPNLPHLEEELKYREKQLDIVITNYHLGKALNKEFYDVDLNEYEEEEDTSTEE
jgi:antitoxin component YwqK of YwqJK toxin-antitoxin module